MTHNAICLKSILAGIVAAIGAVLLAAILVVIGTFAWLQFEMWRQRGQESGGIGAVSVGTADSIVVVLGLVLGVLGFAVGFWWEFRRASR